MRFTLFSGFMIQFIKKVISILVAVYSILLIQYIFPYTRQTKNTPIWYDNNNTVMVWHKQTQFESFQSVPSRLVQLVVSIEDKRFWMHPWVDPVSIARALWLWIQWVRPIQGASTVDQQVIKLDRGQFTRNRRAKILENRWALNLQLHHSKETILLRYLNTIPFSHQIVGWKAACESYRNKSCEYLSDEELLLTLVIGQLWANPYTEAWWKQVLGRAQMFSRVMPELFSGSLILTDALSDRLHSFPAPLDPRVTEFIKKTLTAWKSAYDTSLSQRLDSLLERTKVQRNQYSIEDCCVVVLDAQGNLVSMNMCRSWDDEASWKINSCLLPRQTWSAIKPFVYLYAFHHLWLQATDTIVDEPVSYDLWGWALYDPKNFDLTYHGEVTYAYALWNSLNVPAVKTVYQIGVEPFLQFIKEQINRLAPNTPLNPKTAEEVGLSVALGTYEMSVWQFAQLRRLLLPTWWLPQYEIARRAIVAILSDPTNKLVSFWQDTPLNTPWWAVKTGTSRKFVDGWICGVQTAVQNWKVICLWLGNVSQAPMLGPSSEVWSYLWSLIVDEIEK